MARRAVLLILFVAFAITAVAPIRSYDFFWHLATGRWIVEHRALPATDPFATASDRTPWINGEWLFEAPLYLAYRAFGFDGFAILRGLFAAALFVGAAGLALPGTREDDGWTSPAAPTVLASIGFAGAMPLLDVRPSAVAALLVMLAIAAAERGKLLLFCAITLVWINVHPSALIAPLIALVIARNVKLPLASFALLFVNPYGWRAIAAPIELTRYVRSGAITNVEWLPSPPLLFPLLYVCVAIGIAAFITTSDKCAQISRIILFAVFSYLAIRHARNQGLFFATFPLLVAPAIRRDFITRQVAAIGYAAIILFAGLTGDHHLGFRRGMFPFGALDQLQQSGLHGNFYNPDQFGGLLIWTTYPERRALTDGRNELYRTFNAEYEKARGDERAWRALLRKYDVTLAVDEYRPPLPVVDYSTKQQKLMPASLAYWPRRDWALIGYDSVGMVFARRAAFPPEVIARLETRVVPDAINSPVRAD